MESKRHFPYDGEVYSMTDVYQSPWFEGTKGNKCRIVFEEKGPIYYEFLDYEDGKRDTFQWRDNMICGFSFSRMGLKCIPLPMEIDQDVKAFVSTLPRGKKLMRNGSKLVQV